MTALDRIPVGPLQYAVRLIVLSTVDHPPISVLDKSAARHAFADRRVSLCPHSTTPTPTSSPTSLPTSSRECRRVVQLATGITSANRACRTCRRGCRYWCRRRGMRALCNICRMARKTGIINVIVFDLQIRCLFIFLLEIFSSFAEHLNLFQPENLSNTSYNNIQI